MDHDIVNSSKANDHGPGDAILDEVTTGECDSPVRDAAAHLYQYSSRMSVVW